MPALDPSAKMWMDMLVPLKTMMESMNQGEHIPLLDTLSTMTKQLAILYTLFWTEYDGGEFCRGLIFSKEIGTIFWTYGSEMVSEYLKSMSEPQEPQEPQINPELQKKASVAGKK